MCWSVAMIDLPPIESGTGIPILMDDPKFLSWGAHPGHMMPFPEVRVTNPGGKASQSFVPPSGSPESLYELQLGEL